jgi:hypothetical protein
VRALALLAFVSVAAAQRPLPPGAVSLVNEDRFGSRLALCIETASEGVQRGPRKIPATEVWAGEHATLRKLNAGLGACDPAWSPDGRYLVLVAEEGLWLFSANSAEGRVRVESRVPPGLLAEYSYRAFARPEWSSDGALVALVVTNVGMSWVEVFEMASGRLLYTSPPGIHTFSWGANARDLKVGSLDIHLPAFK